ncbi:uncharacterized protein LOC110068519 isoform X2 [Orbicella faveolata]|uniref:uncharacterized protein LOC110068519 isoform X2 n=1 Tax=Orbicella faveolata TaxID=48498 RepID=UPI0009E3E62E|nr:uncharacterized protein LOC110068519 isoform X2 [Orbicella faveolata]
MEEGSRVSINQLLRVTLLSSEWRSSKGGLSTISRKLAIELAKHHNVEVCVYLPECSEEDKKVAGSHSVQLIEAEKRPGYEKIDWLASLPKNHLPHCVIGHGLHLGKQIPLIKEHHDCKWIQVVHTDPEELGKYKSYEEAISKGEQKHQAEVKLCELADQVVAVGPKLADAYSRHLRFSGKDQDVINLTPSIFTEFCNVQQATEERNTFCVLVFGRGDNEDFKLKGYDIAVQAVAELDDTSYQLMFVGAPAGKEDEVATKLLEYGIRQRQLTVRRFKESREELAKLFCSVDLTIMPSRTEGFGLTALEALSAGLPVLVSGNSGLGDALETVPSGSYHVVDSEDTKEWAKAIKNVRQKGREVRLEDANLLREKFAAKYSWEKQCGSLVKKMWHLTFGSVEGGEGPAKKGKQWLPGAATQSSHHRKGSTKRGRDSQGSPDQSPAGPPKKPRIDSVKDGQVSDEDMENLAEQLGDEWVKLGRRLKVSHVILRGLSRNTQLYPDLSLKACEMLSKWRNREGDSATYQVLYEALCHEHVGRKDLAQTICCHK